MSPNQDCRFVIEGYCLDNQNQEKQFLKTPRQDEVAIVTGDEALEFQLKLISKEWSSLMH